MSESPKSHDPLQTWISQATRGLAEKSRWRLQGEIQAHYESAYEDALTTGATQQQANQTALASLGDPKFANREYRKVLLTTSEAKYLTALRPLTDSRTDYQPRLIATAFLVGLLLTGGLEPWFAACLAPSILVDLAIRLLPRQKPWLFRVRRYTWVPILLGIIWLSKTAGLRLLSSETPPQAVLLLAVLTVVLFACWMLIQSHRLRSSLRRKLPREKWPLGLEG